MQRTAQHTRTHESKGDMMTWAGNTLAMLGAAIGVGAGAIGLLIAFGYINEDSTKPFSDGMTWLLGGLVVTIVANVFRREHHIVGEYSTTSNNHKADDADKVIGNAMGMILGGLAIASAVIGILVNFEYIKDGNVNPFEDGLIWLTAGGVLGVAALTFRREPDVSDKSTPTVRRREVDDTVYDEGDLRIAPSIDSTPRNRG